MGMIGMAKTVLITGCSSGFGRAAAEAFHHAGWNVAATMRDPASWPSPPDGIATFPLDVTDPDSIATALTATVERFGALDCLVNNAGLGLFSIFESTPIAKVRELFETNLFGAMEASRLALPHLRDTQGTIINVSSGAVIVPDPLMTAYAASKWALEGFTESLMYELAFQRVTVRLVQPGFAPTTAFVPSVFRNSEGIDTPPAYQPLVDHMLDYYSGDLGYAPMTDKDVADAILTAATDSGTRLRYRVGAEVALTSSKRGMDEDAYLTWARGRFGTLPGT
jgi:NAD(P)-dependent dehydrogenase (short-subunit alcohol dehydrogenase family)